jgi:hypothetical protein
VAKKISGRSSGGIGLPSNFEQVNFASFLLSCYGKILISFECSPERTGFSGDLILARRKRLLLLKP